MSRVVQWMKGSAPTLSDVRLLLCVIAGLALWVLLMLRDWRLVAYVLGAGAVLLVAEVLWSVLAGDLWRDRPPG